MPAEYGTTFRDLINAEEGPRENRRCGISGKEHLSGAGIDVAVTDLHDCAEKQVGRWLLRKGWHLTRDTDPRGGTGKGRHRPPLFSLPEGPDEHPRPVRERLTTGCGPFGRSSDLAAALASVTPELPIGARKAKDFG